MSGRMHRPRLQDASVTIWGRQMFRFTIRDVLWLTVVVAFGVAWWLEHRAATKGASDLRVMTQDSDTWQKLYKMELRRSLNEEGKLRRKTALEIALP